MESTKRFAEKNNLEVEFIDHSESDGLTSEGAAKATGAKIEQIIKVLCFVDKKGNKAFVIAQGHKRINSKGIPGLKKPRMASAEELKNWFNAEPGGIPPIGLPEEIPKFVDKGLVNLGFVIGSGGSRFVGLKIKPRDIVNQPNTEVLDMTE